MLLEFDTQRMLSTYDKFVTYVRSNPKAPRRRDDNRHLAESEGQAAGRQPQGSPLSRTVQVAKLCVLGAELLLSQQGHPEANTAILDLQTQFAKAGQNLLLDLARHTGLLRAHVRGRV